MTKKEEKVVVEDHVDVKDDIKNNATNEKTVENQENENMNEKDLTIKTLEETIVNLKNEIDSIKKAAADIVNRNKQMEIDKKYASSDLVKRLLVPMSYFEGALKFKTEDEAFNNFLKGFEMIYNLILDQLNSEGLKEIDTKIDDDFNPHIHDVTEIVEVEDGTSDKILEIIHKGFYFKDRVIKPVKVKVSKIKEEEKTDEQENQNVN